MLLLLCYWECQQLPPASDQIFYNLFKNSRCMIELRMFPEQRTSSPFYLKQNRQPWAAPLVRNHQDLVSSDDASLLSGEPGLSLPAPPWVGWAWLAAPPWDLPEWSPWLPGEPPWDLPEWGACLQQQHQWSSEAFQSPARICLSTCCAFFKPTQQQRSTWVKLVAVHLLQHWTQWDLVLVEIHPTDALRLHWSSRLEHINSS